MNWRPFMNKQQPPQQQTLNVQIDQQVGEGVYANFFMIVNSDSEFVLDFGRVVPGMPNAKIYSRVITNPQHAKQLLKLLEKNVDAFEKQFGEIKIPNLPNQDNKNIGFHPVK